MPTETSTASTLGDDLGHLSSVMTQHYHTWSRQQGVHYSQLAVLHTLLRHPKSTQKQICELWALPKQTISTVCKQYVDEGVIAFAQAEDKREKRLSLTAKGRRLARPIVARLEAMDRQVFAAFGQARAERLVKELGELVAIYGRHVGA